MNVILPKPYKAQLKVLRPCFDKSTFYICLNGSRQVGKTFICTLVALKWALEANNQNIMIVSPTDSQVKKIYKQMMLMLTPLISFVKNYKGSSGDIEIVFKNGSTILFKSAASEESLRGYVNTHLILDECAFIKEETWHTYLAPTLSAKGKKVLFSSTPKGNNFFARLYSNGIEGVPNYKSFKLTYHNNPYANLAFIEEQRLTIPEEIFRQEYLGEFIDAAGCFRNINDIATLLKANYLSTMQYYVGVDIALKGDYTVAVCFNNKMEMVDYIRFNNTDINILLNNLKTFFTKWKPKKINIESNSQGLPIIQSLRNLGIQNISEFHTNATSKPLIINQLIAAAGKNEIKLLNDNIIKSEFNAFTATLTKSGTIKYAASFGHDDIVMATAIAFECAVKNKFRTGFVM